MDLQVVPIIFVLFVAAFIASTFGFGVGLTTMPILAIMVDMRTAASLSALVGMTVVCIVILKHWRKIQFRIAWYLIVSSAVLIATVMGNHANRSIPKDKFIMFVHALLILLGLLLSIQVIQTTIFTPN